MIWLCADTHGMIDIQKAEDYMEDVLCYQKVTKEDYMIILGDVGVCWDGDEEDKYVRDALSALPCTVLWIDGNHENFDLLEEFPEKEWHGGMVHFIRNDIIHLMRGQVFEIEGKKIFTFGGANSIDKAFRTERITWWQQEMPDYGEYEEGLKNLERSGNKVDYILTHTCPGHIAVQLTDIFYPGEEPLQNYFDEISQMVKFDDWYFGHWHTDETIDGKYHCLYYEIIELPE